MACFKCDENPTDVIKSDATVLLKIHPKDAGEYVYVYVWERIDPHSDHAEQTTDCRFTHEAKLPGEESFMWESICRNRPNGGADDKAHAACER